MGSYLSIVNNTENDWFCRVGPDEKMIKIFGIIVTSIGTIAAVIGTLGAAAPVAAVIGSTAVTVLGVASTALKITAGVSGFALNVVKGINDNLISKGYNEIEHGKKHRYGTMAMLLWRQGTCVRSYDVDERTVRTETVYMRPIFSGSLPNSNRDHDIQWWINKHGVETKDVVAKEPETTPPHAPTTTAPLPNQQTKQVNDKQATSSNQTNPASQTEVLEDLPAYLQEDIEEYLEEDVQASLQSANYAEQNEESIPGKVHAGSPQAQDDGDVSNDEAAGNANMNVDQDNEFMYEQRGEERRLAPHADSGDTEAKVFRTGQTNVSDLDLSSGNLMMNYPKIRRVQESSEGKDVKVFHTGETEVADLGLQAGDVVVIYANPSE